ncbi:CoA transferase subunit A [Aggregatilinea lenta]|uniref:CoA transferase subunit A n=1 Tax=Aggregatilinea lenta TaxID=913108 RepID=UPI001EE92073|nr:CoA-transferase [Aggregatilinea lenta]
MRLDPDRRVSLAEAASLVQPGMTLALGGNLLYRRPVAFVTELLRRPHPPTDLTLLAFTAGYESDLLVGAGCVARTRTCYFGLEAFGLAPMFTQAASAGSIQVIEETEASIAMGIRARMAGVGFMPSHAWQGTDLPRLRPDVKTVRDPYSGDELIAFPAISADVAVLHALVADRHGNARLNKNLGIDPELCVVAEHVIVTAERVVDRLDDADLPGILVTGVVEAPRGAWPTSCYPNYPVAGGEILRYMDACAGDAFDAYVDRLAGRA